MKEIHGNPQPTHFDMIIVGAGLSGIGTACHFKRDCPDKSFLILESREVLGGTWDLFRYPGIRSDSDMHTLGYNFKPWKYPKAIADGSSILSYIDETAREYNLLPHIRFGQRVIAAAWSGVTGRWELSARQKDGSVKKFTASFVAMCPGYYRYEKGHTPEFKNSDAFNGTVIHPQHWPETFDYTDKNIVVIGSGATAVTLIPKLAEKAARVTMLQRSPTYIASAPAKDRIAIFLRKFLNERTAYKVARWKNLKMHHYLYNSARKKPEKTKAYLRKQIRKELGPDYDIDTHFTPRYDPWDQRLCLVPDSDLFKAIRSKKADVVTDTIDEFTPKGITLTSGTHLEADVIVTATGIDVTTLGDVTITVDGTPVNPGDLFGYKGMMFSGVPNLVSVFGYTNASWTLRADLIAHFMCRLVNHMQNTDTNVVTPIAPVGMQAHPWLDFQAGYIQRVIDQLPKQGDKVPWTNKQDYKLDIQLLAKDPVDDGHLRFSTASQSTKNKVA